MPPPKKANPNRKLIVPLTKEELTFAEKYAHNPDLEKAAAAAGLDPRMGVELYQRRKVRAEIKRLSNLVTKEKAKVVARAIVKRDIITKNNLDKELRNITKVDLKEIPQLGPTKLNAIELGYRRIGLLIDDNFVPDKPAEGGPSTGETPRIFRAVQQQILTHQVITQQMTTTTVEGTTEVVPPAAQEEDSKVIDSECLYKF